MKKKTTISVILFIVGFMVALGTVGSAECDTISLNQLVIQSGIAVALMIGGGIIGI